MNGMMWVIFLREKLFKNNEMLMGCEGGLRVVDPVIQ